MKSTSCCGIAETPSLKMLHGPTSNCVAQVYDKIRQTAHSLDKRESVQRTREPAIVSVPKLQVISRFPGS